jgi:hypothetical protein
MARTREEIIDELDKINKMSKQEKLIYDLQKIKDRGYFPDEDRVNDILDILIEYFKNQ